jgi:hypothetical protein
MTAASSQGEWTTTINQAFDLAKKAVDEVNKGFQALIDHVSSWKLAAVIIPVPVVIWIKQQIKNVSEHMKLLIDLVRYAVERQTPIVSLIYQSFNWLEHVKAPMSELSSVASEPRQGNSNFNKWEGDAAKTYGQKIGKQVGAINAITSHADFISAWLYKIADENVKYMVELADFGAKMAGAIAKAAANTGTVINIPFAIDTLANEVGDAVEASVKQLINIGERFFSALGNVRDITSVLSDHTNFPSQQWPQAVTG